MTAGEWTTLHPDGALRVLVTRQLPGFAWKKILVEASARVDIFRGDRILAPEEIEAALGTQCDGCIGQLSEVWDKRLLGALKAAGGIVYSNYAVGYDNVDIASATNYQIAVGNTPGVLTETTAEMAAALTLAAARRIVESDAFMRKGLFQGWAPGLFLGEHLWRKTVGIIGAGRIGTAYGRIMVEGFKMHLLYYDPVENPFLEAYVRAYNAFLSAQGQEPLSCRRVDDIELLLKEADVVSLHCVLDRTTYHMIDAPRLSLMKQGAILINTSRGPLIDEAALVAHCRRHPTFKVGLDVYEHEPFTSPGLVDLPNVVVLPHIGSASRWTREAMAIIAARNVVGILKGYPVWCQPDMSVFLSDACPKATPSVVNARALDLRLWSE